MTWLRGPDRSSRLKLCGLSVDNLDRVHTKVVLKWRK
jgi:hypothetical protein